MLAYVVYGVRLLAWALFRVVLPAGRPPDYVQFVLDGAPPELPPPGPGFPFRRRGEAVSLQELSEAFARIAADERVRGVVLVLRDLSLAPARADALRDLIGQLKAAGRRVVVHAADLSTQPLRVAVAADEVLLQEGSRVGPLGAVRRFVFLKDALAKAGIEADVVPSGPYKWPGLLDRTDLPDPVRENVEGLLDAEMEALVADLVASRGLPEAVARKLVDRGPLTDLEARDAGLADGLLAEDALPAHLGTPGRPARMAGWDPARRAVRRPPPRAPGPYVALIRVQGPIVRGRSQRPPGGFAGGLAGLAVPLVTAPRTGDLTVVQAARRVLRDRRALACVVHIESPGGSATASEAIYQALAALDAAKPVVAALGVVAGSGGYYAAAACRQIVAQPGTLTGSIGALWAKISAADLYARLGIHRNALSRGRHANMHDPGRRYNKTQLKLVEKGIARIDALFRERVGTGRRMEAEAVAEVAGGRLFSGAQARDAGLVDHLGGLGAALERARGLGSLPPTAPLREVGAPARRLLAPRAEAAPLIAYVADGFRLLGGEGTYTLCPWTWNLGGD